MRTLHRFLRAVPAVAVGTFAVVTLAACHDAGPTSPELDDIEPVASLSDGAPFRVLTRNVYVGGDTDLVFQADFSNPISVITAAGTVWAQVRASAIPARAAGIVDEIAREQPAVVALQEAFRFQSTSGLVIDWIDAIEAEIALRGLPYFVAAVQPGTSAVLPVSPTELVAFTDRIAVLVHEDVAVSGIDQGTYQAELLLAQAPPPIGDVRIRRGWIRVEMDVRGAPYHLVATHLETQGIRPIHDAQAAELATSIAAGLDGVTIVAGDLNSDAAAGPGAPSWTPTYEMMRSRGFADAWLRSAASRRSPGFTCCQDKDLRNEASDLEERIDFVLVRVSGPQAEAVELPGAVAADVVGDSFADRLGIGLWPSDHAGLVASLRIARGLVADR